ncbi:MAG: LytTR family DNA-binding domain-containing protein [Aureisphaera sp.]
MKINCLIVDDEISARKILKRYINDIPGLSLIAECKNAFEVMDVLNEKQIDVIFLDIEMPKLSGLSFLKTLKYPPEVIITTAFREYALEGYDLNVTDYLLKPISFERFVTSVNKILKKSETTSFSMNDFTYFKSGKKNIQVFFKDILMVEGLGNYVKVHTVHGIITTYDRMSDMEVLLPSASFIRIHRSYIVALDKITAYGSDYVEIGSKQLSVGNTFRESFYGIISKLSQRG